MPGDPAVVQTQPMLPRAESQARGLLKDLTSLKSGQSTGVQAHEFIRRHQRWIFKTSSPCDGNTCVASFRIYNTWLSELRLEPPAMFQAEVSVSHGIVNYIGASLFRSMPIFPTFQAPAGGRDRNGRISALLPHSRSLFRAHTRWQAVFENFPRLACGTNSAATCIQLLIQMSCEAGRPMRSSLRLSSCGLQRLESVATERRCTRRFWSSVSE